MRTIIFSRQADDWFSENCVSFRERDCLIEYLSVSFNSISSNFQNYAIPIDSLQAVLELEIDSATILIVRVYHFGGCE